MLDVKWGSTCTSIHNGNGAVHECVCMCERWAYIASVQQCLIFLTRHKLFFFSYSADWWTPGSGARRLWRTRTVGVVMFAVCVCVCVSEHVARVYVGGSAPGSVHPWLVCACECRVWSVCTVAACCVCVCVSVHGLIFCCSMTCRSFQELGDCDVWLMADGCLRKAIAVVMFIVCACEPVARVYVGGSAPGSVHPWLVCVCTWM